MNSTPTYMVGEINSRCHNPAGGTTRILGWFNEVQDEIEKWRQDWLFCMAYDQEIAATDAAGSDYDLPADFDHFMSVWNDTDDDPMTEKELGWLRRHDPDRSDKSSPRWYIMLGKTAGSEVQKVRFVDDVDGTYTIGHDYYRKLPPLDTAGGDIPSLVPSPTILMKMVEVKALQDNEEPDDQRRINDLRVEIYGSWPEPRRSKGLKGLLIKHNTQRPNLRQGIKPHYLTTFEGYKYNGG